jgi:threonine dehydratase
MRLPDVAGVERALAEIRPYHPETPLIRSELLSLEFDADVWLKNETVTPIGCFKLRGALTDVLRAKERNGHLSRLVTSSSGNHGQGVAYAGRLLDIPVTIFLPQGANPVKLAMIRALGAEVRSAGPDSYGAKQIAQAFAAQHEGCHFVDDGNSADLAEGAGTVGLEIAQRLQDIDSVFVPVGDAALVNGLSCAMKASQPNLKVVGVQARQAAALAESRREGRVVEIMPDTIADGLATRAPAELALKGMMAFVDEFELVEEQALLSAMQTMAVAGHILAEPSGAAGLAAAWKRRASLRGKRFVVVVTGANATASILTDAFRGVPLFDIPTVTGPAADTRDVRNVELI